jgi:hypothetical protein
VATKQEFNTGNVKSVLKKYAKYVKSPAIGRGVSKRQRRREKASQTIRKRWKGEDLQKSVTACFSPPAQWEVFELVELCHSVGSGMAEKVEYRNGINSI